MKFLLIILFFIQFSVQAELFLKEVILADQAELTPEEVILAEQAELFLKEVILADQAELFPEEVILADQAELFPEEVILAEKGIWKYSIGLHNATSFFIEEKYLVTNFHVLADPMAEDKNFIDNIILSQEGSDRVLGVKKVLGLSAIYDLAILEIEGKVSDYLNFADSKPSDNLYISGYPSEIFKTVIHKKENGLYETEYTYEFSVNHSDLFGASGSPVLNENGEVIGVTFASLNNMAIAVKPNYVDELKTGSLGTDCSQLTLIQCIIEEQKNLKRKAEQGHALAQHNLGRMYYHGEGVEQDHEEAFRWFKASAEQDYAPAQYILGRMYYHGDEVEQDHEEAFRWTKVSAEQGYNSAQYTLGYMYYYGKGVEQDHEEAFRWTKVSAEQGYTLAQYTLGRMYYYGYGVEQDHMEAFRLFFTAILCYTLPNCLIDSKSLNKAIRLLFIKMQKRYRYTKI